MARQYGVVMLGNPSGLIEFAGPLSPVLLNPSKVDREKLEQSVCLNLGINRGDLPGVVLIESRQHSHLRYTDTSCSGYL
jgi:hypothetical protein